MRLFIAGLDSETNTFTNFPTTRRTFEEGGLWRGNADAGNSWLSPVPAAWKRLAAEAGFECIESLFAAAQPAGPVLQSVYEDLRDEILEDLRALGPFDMVLLHLHGAMVADQCDDCEGDILARVRELVPDETVVGALLDPHCHLTEKMVTHADLLVACKHFPHDDYAERAAELFWLAARIARADLVAVPGVFDCRMIGLYPTGDEPMASIVKALTSAERSGPAVSVSFIHGFPWGDTPDTGSKVLVYSDRDPEQAQACARSLGEAVYDARDELRVRYPKIDEALDEAAQGEGLIVLADTGDNAGGGAPGDNTRVLAALLQRGTTDVALGSLWDPQVAMLCAEVGAGATLPIRLGGKTNYSSGSPLDVRASIRAVSRDHWQTSLGDTRQYMGISVWLQIEGVDVVVSSVRSQVFSPDLFAGLGIELSRKRIVVVKSTNHFHSRFSPIARRIIRMSTPGALTLDFANIAYRKRSGDFFPRVSDPLLRGSF